jgi:hypothetical protein
MLNIINHSAVEENLNNHSKLIIYGESGVGTTTLCSTIASSILIPISKLPKVSQGCSLAEPIKDLKELYNILNELKDNDDFETIIIDDLLSLELLIWDYTCLKYQNPEIEAFGYGQGYSYALTIWRKLLDFINTIDKNIILIGKATIGNVTNYNGAFNYADLAIDKKVKPFIQNWCDKAYFLTYTQKVLDNGEKYITHVLYNNPSIYFWTKGNDSTEDLNLNEISLISSQNA